MKPGRLFAMVLLAAWLAAPALSWSLDLVVGPGGNLKPGMPLNEAIKMLGIPESITLNRGPETTLDNLEIVYKEHGLLIRALNEGKQVEGIELDPTFKGKLDSGIKLGDKFPTIIAKYGVPKSMTSQVARYPEQGLYFLLNNDTLLSIKVFVKDTKLVQLRMMNP